MRIKEIHIYGYGKFINYTLKNLNDLQLIFGENEAGKSTIMSFIRSVLFGFPTQRDVLKRYEPRHHSAYGGFIICQFEKYGEVKIERVRGKAKGDVNVYLKDGTVGNEERLNQLLGTIDETLYDQVFTFNLQGIQEIEKLTDDDINRYLISAGTTGSNQLLKLESELVKEMDQLFLRRGQKPVINQELKALREIDQKLKKAKLNQADYQSYQNEKIQLEHRISQINEERKQFEQKVKTLNNIYNHWDLLEEQKRLQLRKHEIGEVSFPIDGLNRVEKYLEQLTTEEAKYISIEERIEKHKRLVSQLDIRNEKKELVRTIEGFINDAPRYRLLQDEILTYKQKMDQLTLKINNTCDETNIPNDIVDQIDTINLSVQMKNKLLEAVQEHHILQTKLNEVDEELRELRNRQTQLEEQEQYIQAQLISEVDFKRLNDLFKQHIPYEQLLREQKQMNEELKDFTEKEARKKQQEKRKKQTTNQVNLLFILTSIGLVIWSVLSKQWPLIIFASLMIIMFILHFQRSKEVINSSTDHYIERLKTRLNEITMQIEQANNESFLLYEQQVDIRDKWKELFTQLEQNEQFIHQHTRKMNELKEKHEKNKMECDEIKRALFIGEDAKISELQQVFEALQLIRSETRHEKLLLEQMHELKNEWKDWYTRLQKIAQQLSFDEQESDAIIYKMKEYLKVTQEKKLKSIDLNEKIDEESSELQSVFAKKTQIKKNLTYVYELAAVNNEEAFREKARLYEEYINILDRLALLHPKLQAIPLTGHITKEEVKDDVQRYNEQIQQMTSQLEEMRQRLAHIQYTIEQFESGGIYTDLLHDYYQKHDQFNDSAKKWFELAIAKQLLTNTMNEYKLERLPKVMKKAIQYFRILTKEKYIFITFKNDQDLLVERNDRTLFTPNELSQGTKEQLYIAFRLALVSILKETIQFPVIIDDGFVNFDNERTEAMIQLLNEMAKDTQILFFSCHHLFKRNFDMIHELSKVN